MELWTSALSCWKCHWPDLKSAGLFRRNLFPNSLKTSTVTLILTLTLWPINSGVLTSLLLPHLLSSLTDSLPSLNLLCHSKTDARFMQDAPKAVWRIPYVSVAFFLSLKQNFISCRSSKVSSRPDCIFEIHQLWQSGFSRVYSNCCCSCSFESEIIKIGESSHKMYSNNIVNFQESTTILNACTKKGWKLIYIYFQMNWSASEFCFRLFVILLQRVFLTFNFVSRMLMVNSFWFLLWRLFWFGCDSFSFLDLCLWISSWS